MSIKIQGKLPASTESIEILNQEPVYGKVPVTVHGHVNRDTDAKLIAKYLKEGWNWNLFSPIGTAQFPPESGIEDKLLDGDHRRHMHMLAFPERSHIASMIYQVKDMDEYHELFTKLNLYNRKNVTKEEVFVHDVLCHRSDAIATEKELINCGLSVHGSTDKGGVVGMAKGPRVKIGGFRRTLKHGSNNTKLAASLIKSTWKQDTDVKVELLEGLAILFSLYPALSNPRTSISSDFTKWFTTRQGLYSQRDVALDYKSAGGSVVNRAALCVARGIIKDFRKVKMPGGSKVGNKQNALPVSKVNDLIEG